MCLVNCAKTMDIIPTAMTVLPATELLCSRPTICGCNGIDQQCLECIGKLSRRGSDVKPDAMSIATQWTRKTCQSLNHKWNNMQNSKMMR